MDTFPRPEKPRVGDEKAMLQAFLNFHRATFVIKVSGLSEAKVRQVMSPSSMTMLSLLKHVTYAERYWFQYVFAGLDVYVPQADDDPDPQWQIEPGDTLASGLAFCQQEVAHSDVIIAAHTLAALAKRPPGPDHSLRYIMLHMIEETARHNGHADIFREILDGKVGE